MGRELAGVIADVLQHGAQVFEIEQQHAVVVGDLEDHREHAFLGFIQTQNTRQQQRAHFRHRRTHRVALLAKYVPKRDGEAAIFKIRQAQLFSAFRDFWIVAAGLTNSREVAFHVGHKNRHTDGAEVLSHHL